MRGQCYCLCFGFFISPMLTIAIEKLAPSGNRRLLIALHSIRNVWKLIGSVNESVFLMAKYFTVNKLLSI